MISNINNDVTDDDDVADDDHGCSVKESTLTIKIQLLEKE